MKQHPEVVASLNRLKFRVVPILLVSGYLGGWAWKHYVHEPWRRDVAEFFKEQHERLADFHPSKREDLVLAANRDLNRLVSLKAAREAAGGDE